MANRNAAFKEVMGELKDRIRAHTSDRHSRPSRPHEEPDGDESGGEEESSEDEDEEKLENFDECPTCGEKLDSHNKCSSCS
jgi:hypothetical protein